MTSDRSTGLCNDVVCAAMAQMVPVRMRDDGGLHGLPGIDVKIPCCAVKAASGGADEGFRIVGHSECESRHWHVKVAVMIRCAGNDYNPQQHLVLGTPHGRESTRSAL